MAKKRKEKSEDEEEFDFKLPKFDEEKFLKKERRNIKTLFISFLMGLLFSFISFGFWMLMYENTPQFAWPIIFLFGVINAIWIRYLFIRLKIDISEFGRKEWFTSFAIYFFTWLIVLVVLVNPPIYDSEPPRIDLVALPGMQEPGGTVQIVAKITDNAGVQKQDITIDISHETLGDISVDDFIFEQSILKYEFENPDNLIGKFSYTIKAVDRSGKTTIQQGNFTYSNSTIKIPTPQGTETAPGPSINYATSIKFDINTEISRLYYTVNDGKPINVTEKEGDYYVTYPEYMGWPRGQNVTLHVYAELIHYFPQPFSTADQVANIQNYSNTIIDNAVYYFNVSDETEIGTKSPPEVTLPLPELIQVPGFEMVVFIGSLGVSLVLFSLTRKRKR